MSLFGDIFNPGNIFGGGHSGGSASSSSGSSSSQSTTTNVTVPVTVDNADVADAIAALGAQAEATARAQSQAQIVSSALTAGATVKAAKIAASAQPSLYVIGGAIIAVLGLAFTAGLIKLPRGLTA